MEDENKNEEKLIANPPAPELLDSGDMKPLLSGKEFIAKTPLAELKNVFGITDKELPDPRKPMPASSAKSEVSSEKFHRFESLLPELLKKETAAAPQFAKQFKNADSVGKKILRFSVTLFLIIIVIIIGLYIWGGMLKP